MYANIFTAMQGGNGEKSYAEKVQECKDLLATLKKDKEWTKLTGNSKYYQVERVIEQMVKEGKTPKFKCLIYPDKRGYKFSLPHGVYTELSTVKRVRTDATGRTELRIGGSYEDGKLETNHNHSDWLHTGKKYTSISFSCEDFDKRTTQDIELFVNIPKKQFEK